MSQNPNRRHVVVEAGRPRNVNVRSYQHRPREIVVAGVIIAAAALATLAALLITSRPYDPMNSSIAPQTSVTPAPLVSEASPKPSPSTAATPAERAAEAESPVTGGETAPPDDAEIKSQVEQMFSADPALSGADITTIVENGRVTLVGSVDSTDAKQRAQRIIRAIKGVVAINDQLSVRQVTPG